MGNKPARKMGQQPYHQIVEDAIAQLKERPGSTQSDIFQYLEAKYEKKISPKNKKNLETVIRSVIKSKMRGGPGRSAMRGFGRRRGGFKARGGPRRKFGRTVRGSGKVRNMSRSLGASLIKKKPPKILMTLKSRKKSVAMSGGYHRQLLTRAKRGSKLLIRPAKRTSSVGSMSMSLLTRRGKRS